MHPSRSSTPLNLTRAGQLWVLLLLLFTSLSQAQESPTPRYVADIELQTEAELSQLLSRAEQMFVGGDFAQGDPALTLVLHGPVLRSLLRPNYIQSKPVVDQAATLSALGVVELKACLTWMGEHGLHSSDLQPFVQTVSLGPVEVGRLIRDEGYLYF